MNQPLISVIVPIYNVEKYLDKCVDSIVNQTYKNLEIILVDDGSPDNCPAMCDEWAKKDSRIKVIHKTNGGLSDARNFGIDIASGNYLFFLDSDDFIDKDCIQKLFDSIWTDKSDISITLPIRYLPNQNTKIMYKSNPKGVFNKYVILECMFKYSLPWSACGKLFKIDLFKKKRFPVNRLCEDLFLIPSIIYDSNKISIIEENLYYYRYNTNSIMNIKPSEKFINDRFDAISFNSNIFCNSNSQLKDSILNTLIDYCFYTISDLYDTKTNPNNEIIISQAKRNIILSRKHILKSKNFSFNLKFKCLISIINFHIVIYIRKLHNIINRINYK